VVKEEKMFQRVSLVVSAALVPVLLFGSGALAARGPVKDGLSKADKVAVTKLFIAYKVHDKVMAKTDVVHFGTDRTVFYKGVVYTLDTFAATGTDSYNFLVSMQDAGVYGLFAKHQNHWSRLATYRLGFPGCVKPGMVPAPVVNALDIYKGFDCRKMKF
jgi:hypothetical protein